ncbi:MAG: TIR domain-containing protein [Leptolyngbyaceae cyanobacterium SM2_5_2]|nr:TIR domain-containing protein [Leptolyngbyaceae cyanobacterium SM2_5_2]
MLSAPVSIFLSYSRKDEALMQELKGHLEPLQRGQLIRSWYDGCITPGQEWEPQIKKNLETAQIILLLISVDFINSEYCYNIELIKAIERHKTGSAYVIPVILRSCLWQEVPVGDMRLGQLQALPKNAQPISKWSDRDEAYTNVVEGLHRTIQALQKQREEHYQQAQAETKRQQQEAAEAQALAMAAQPITPNQKDDLSSEKGIDYTHLRDLLKAGNWRDADRETHEVMIRTMGKKAGAWFNSDELLNFPSTDLCTIDRLWVKYSQGKFGFSVQKQIYVECGGKLSGMYPGDKVWNEFCDRVGWLRTATT